MSLMQESSKHPSLTIFTWDCCCWSSSSASCLWLTPSCHCLPPLTVDLSGTIKTPKRIFLFSGTWEQNFHLVLRTKFSYFHEVRRTGLQQQCEAKGHVQLWSVNRQLGALKLLLSAALLCYTIPSVFPTHTDESIGEQQGWTTRCSPQ